VFEGGRGVRHSYWPVASPGNGRGKRKDLVTRGRRLLCVRFPFYTARRMWGSIPAGD